MYVPARGGTNSATKLSPGWIARHEAGRRAAPARHAVGEALQLDAVPVHRRRLGEVVDDRDPHRLAPAEHERRPRDVDRVARRLGAVLAPRSPSRRASPYRRGADCASSRISRGGRSADAPRRRRRARHDVDAEHQAAHAVRHRPRAAVRSRASASWRRDVEGEVAVEDPVPLPLRHPAQGGGLARLQELRDLERARLAPEDPLSLPVAPAVDVEEEPVQVHRVGRDVGLITRQRTVLPRG